MEQSEYDLPELGHTASLLNPRDDNYGCILSLPQDSQLWDQEQITRPIHPSEEQMTCSRQTIGFDTTCWGNKPPGDLLGYRI